MGQEKYAVITHLDVDKSSGCQHPNSFFFECPVCNRPVKITMGCGKRFDYFCPVCSKKWRNKVFKRYYRAVTTFKNPKFLTLTLKKGSDVGTMYDRLMRIWEMKKYLFKRLKLDGYPIRAWVGVVEPPNHIHLIIDSDYIPKSEISEIWNEITGDSYIVDVKQIKNVEETLGRAAKYISKYLSKASAWVGINLDLLKGFHIVGSWGLPKKSPPAHGICVCGTLHKLKRLSFDDWRAQMWIPMEMTTNEIADRFGLWGDFG